MTRLTWTERKHHSGVDRGVVYSRSGPAEVWNGLISVSETPTDIRERVRYRDGVRIVNHRSEDSFSATLECFTYPDSISNPREPFDMAYRAQTDKGYEFHLVYNVSAQITGGVYSQSETTPFSVKVWTKPTSIPMEHAPSAHLIIDPTRTYARALEAFESVLYGDGDLDPRMPFPEEILEIFDVNAFYQVIDNGDGTFTLEAPDDIFEWLSSTEFEVEWPSAIYLDSDTYVVRNW